MVRSLAYRTFQLRPASGPVSAGADAADASLTGALRRTTPAFGVVCPLAWLLAPKMYDFIEASRVKGKKEHFRYENVFF